MSTPATGVTRAPLRDLPGSPLDALPLEPSDPLLDRLLAEAAVAPKLHVRDATRSRLRPYPCRSHAQPLSYLSRCQQAGHRYPIKPTSRMSGQATPCPHTLIGGLAGAMPGASRPPQGDEAELFLSFNAELQRKIAIKVTTSPQIIEDACAFAWMEFLRYQPDRDGNGRDGCS